MGIADEAALYALGYWMHENHPSRRGCVSMTSNEKLLAMNAARSVLPAFRFTRRIPIGKVAQIAACV